MVENNCNCEEKDNLKTVITSLKGELELCIDKKRAIEDENLSLRDALKDLKGKISELAFEDLDLQNNSTNFAAQILTAYKKRLKRSSNYTNEKYSDEIKKFSITMHGYSPKLYRYSRAIQGLDGVGEGRVVQKY